MKFLDIIHEVVETRTVTPEVQEELNRLFWSQEFNGEELAILEMFIGMLSDGLVISADL